MRTMINVVKPGLYKRLFGSFEVDNSATNKKLNFTPPFTTEQGVEVMVSWYKAEKK
jgi:nucleoside-diphosphate-sugar epimerase